MSSVTVEFDIDKMLCRSDHQIHSKIYSELRKQFSAKVGILSSDLRKKKTSNPNPLKDWIDFTCSCAPPTHKFHETWHYLGRRISNWRWQCICNNMGASSHYNTVCWSSSLYDFTTLSVALGHVCSHWKSKSLEIGHKYIIWFFKEDGRKEAGRSSFYQTILYF